MTSGERLAKKLHLARVIAALTQAEVARRSGVEVKTISSFETGRRIHSAKWLQIESLARVYGYELAEFIAWEPTEVEWDLVHESLVAPQLAATTRRLIAPEDLKDYPSAQSSLGAGGFGR